MNIPTDDYIDKFKDSDQDLPKLFRSCFNDDFERYTVDREVEKYCIHEIGQPIETIDGFSPYDFKKWIFKNVLDLGYSNKFRNDGFLVYHYGGGRGKPKWVERVGKKYQNISLYRLLGHIKDNLEIQNDYSDFQNPILPPFQGNKLRELDPTLGYIAMQDYKKKVWNDRFVYDFKNYYLNPNEWLALNDLPNPIDLLRLSNKHVNWLLLCSHFSRKQSLNYDKASYHNDNINIYVSIRSYLVKNTDFSAIWETLSTKHIWDIFSPHENGMYEGFVGEYPWGVPFRNLLNEYSNDIVISSLNSKLIKVYNSLNVEYEFDSSLEADVSYNRHVPSEIFFKSDKLTWDRISGFNDGTGMLCFVDPHIPNGGRSMLVGNENYLKEFCLKNEYSIVWTIHCEKMVVLQEPRSNSSMIHYCLMGYNGIFFSTEYKSKTRD